MIDNGWYDKMIKESTVTTTPIKILVPQAQDSGCPKCGKITHRVFFMTDNSVHFCCLDGHDAVNWSVPAKLLVLPESDLVGLLLALKVAHVTDALKLIHDLSFVDENINEGKTQ